ncbi:hypothetical protein DFH11DRAFT_1596001 [Phellopilus nigrolimitatus]|nr:hypothetical protein DFH11DRAFT_1596001 [Phellopilus nigrolimitatus]
MKNKSAAYWSRVKEPQIKKRLTLFDLHRIVSRISSAKPHEVSEVIGPLNLCLREQAKKINTNSFECLQMTVLTLRGIAGIAPEFLLERKDLADDILAGWDDTFRCMEYLYSVDIRDSEGGAPRLKSRLESTRIPVLASMLSTLGICFASAERSNAEPDAVRLSIHIWAHEDRNNMVHTYATEALVKMLSCDRRAHKIMLDVIPDADTVAKLALRGLQRISKANCMDCAAVYLQLQLLSLLYRSTNMPAVRPFERSILNCGGISVVLQVLESLYEVRDTSDAEKSNWVLTVKIGFKFLKGNLYSDGGPTWAWLMTRRGLLQLIMAYSMYAEDFAGGDIDYLLSTTLPRYLMYGPCLTATVRVLRRHSDVELLGMMRSSAFFDSWYAFEEALVDRLLVRRLYTSQVHKDMAICQNPSCDKKGERTTFKKCAGCMDVLYCSRKCQKVDWKVFQHRDACRRPAPHLNTLGITRKDEQFLAVLASTDARRNIHCLRGLAAKHYPGLPLHGLAFSIDYTQDPPEYDVFLPNTCNELGTLVHMHCPRHSSGACQGIYASGMADGGRRQYGTIIRAVLPIGRDVIKLSFCYDVSPLINDGAYDDNVDSWLTPSSSEHVWCGSCYRGRLRGSHSDVSELVRSVHRLCPSDESTDERIPWDYNTIKQLVRAYLDIGEISNSGCAPVRSKLLPSTGIPAPSPYEVRETAIREAE